ncbi:MAG: methylenetetrahydrofolate--tRNA-(uracil(54)-C(5))-methyltransferase (FADH(2)-oxidizing) TrmFO [Thermaerobacterales bacterium]
MGRRGRDTLRYGPMKPVGLTDPRTGRRPFAVVQLRQDNAAASLYNLVGFQTSLKWGEQKRIFRMIPGLEKAEFVRLGVIHRNTFIKSPRVLNPTLQTRTRGDLFFAGQITGVEGYIESAAMGMLAGINAARLAAGSDLLVFPRETAIGALSRYITSTAVENFQPMNITFGLLPPPETRIRGKRERKAFQAERGLEALDAFLEQIALAPIRQPSGAVTVSGGGATGA